MTTDELRAKFETWARRNICPDLSAARNEVQIGWRVWQAAHASRDAEVETLRKRIENSPVYYVPTEKPTDEDGWIQVIGSVKALNDMRGKHVRLVIDAAMRDND